MSGTGILLWLLIGGIAGWIAGEFVKGYGLGLTGNIVVGIVGAFVGGFLFSALDVSPGAGLAGSLVTATVGAVVLLYALRLIHRLRI